MQVCRVSSGRFVAGSVETSRGGQARVGLAWGGGCDQQERWGEGGRDQNKWVVWTRVAKLCRGLKLPQRQRHLRLRLQQAAATPPLKSPSRLACRAQEWR